MSEEMEKEIDKEIEEQKKTAGTTTLPLIDADEIRVRTTTELDTMYSGHIDSLTPETAVVSLITSKMMMADKEEMVHSGFIGSACEYAALLVVNEPNGMIYSVNSQYFSCVRVGEEVKITASVRHMDSRKREIDVVAKMDSIKVYEAKINIVIPEYHPLKIHLLDIAGANN